MSVMNVPMAQIAARGVLNDPVAQKLSPASLAALKAAAVDSKASPTPALAQALSDAKAQGYQPQGFSWKALGEGLAAAGLMALAPYAIGALVGGGAATGAGVGIGETGATLGVTPEVAATLGGTTAAAGGATAAGVGLGETAAASGIDPALAASWGGSAAAGSGLTAAETAASAAGSAGGLGQTAAQLGLDSATGGSGLDWSTLLKYGLPAVGAGLGAITDQHNTDAEIQYRRDALAQQQKQFETTTALDESKLDPNRGAMFQNRDLARLDRTQHPPPIYGPPEGSKYRPAMSGITPPQPSADYLASAKSAYGAVASGQAKAPSVLGPPPAALPPDNLGAAWPTTPVSAQTPTAPTSTAPLHDATAPDDTDPNRPAKLMSLRRRYLAKLGDPAAV